MRGLGPATTALEPSLAAVLGSAAPVALRLQLRALQQSFVLHTLLLQKARELHAKYFSDAAVTEDGVSGAANTTITTTTCPPTPAPPLLAFLWLLFVTARASLLPPHSPDLVTSFSLLLSCCHFMLCHVPRQRQRGTAASASSAGDGDALLLTLAASHGAVEHASTVRQLAGLLQQLLMQLLPCDDGGDGTGCPGMAGAAGIPLTGIFDAATGLPHPEALAALRRSYQQASTKAGDNIDGLEFLATAEPAQQQQQQQQHAAPRPGPTATPGTPASEPVACPAGGAGGSAAGTAETAVPMDADAAQHACQQGTAAAAAGVGWQASRSPAASTPLRWAGGADQGSRGCCTARILVPVPCQPLHPAP